MLPHTFRSDLIYFARGALLAFTLLVGACTSLAPERGLAPLDPTYSCVMPVCTLASARDSAVWCAEEFIVRNGYTDLPPSVDSSTVAYESFEFSSGVAARLRGPTNSLERRAIGVCEGGHGQPGYTVVFRAPGPPRETEPFARAVTMSRDFTSLRVQHRNFRIAYLDSLNGSQCARLR